MSIYNVVTLSDSNDYGTTDMITNPHSRRWDASSIDARLSTRVADAPQNSIDFNVGDNTVQCNLDDLTCSSYPMLTHAPNGVERFGSDCECQRLRIIMIVCFVILGIAIASCLFKILSHQLGLSNKFKHYSNDLI